MDQDRVTLDCREMPEAKKGNCTLAISGTESEVLEIAEYHATTKHGMNKDAGLREQLRSGLKREAIAR